MSAKYWILNIMVIMLIACEASKPDVQYSISTCAPIPVPRAAAVSFVVGEYAYVFGGRDAEGNYLNDLWRYDIANDAWTSMRETPLRSRVNATACVHNGIVYIGLGFNGQYSNSTGYLSDWWSYNASTDTWQQLSDFPANTTARAISLVGDGELYVGYGFCWTYERDMYRYNIAEDIWSFIDVHLDRKAFTFPTRSFGGVGTTCQNRYFAGTGFRAYSLNWWGEFLPEGAWVKRKNVPGYKRTTAACAATKDFVYVIGGMLFGGVNTDGKVLSDIQQYNPNTDNWQYVGNLPDGGRMNHIAFSVGNRVYVGLGENEDIQVCGDLYCIYEK
jgi:N-acetylneuraminic acid mutarotase